METKNYIKLSESKKVDGKYTSATIYASLIEQEVLDQIKTVCNQESFKNSHIAIMPDTHFGKGSVIGFTATGKDYVIPNVVGVDISCSISTYKLNKKDIDLKKLDDVIHENIPSGQKVRKHTFRDLSREFRENVERITAIIESKKMKHDKYKYEDSLRYNFNSIGTLGGGNHFIELNRDSDGYLWLTIHCGSRNFGKRICEYYQDKAIDLKRRELKGEQFSISRKDTSDDLCSLEGDLVSEYLDAMNVARKFATRNHEVILEEILKNYGNLEVKDSIFTNHNYIETFNDGTFITRKGAISAYENERVIIPINMRDGSIIGIGKSNKDYNFSAPHGAGRIMSRNEAKKIISLDKFKESMNGIYSTCVTDSTIDESPFAYKSIDDIKPMLEKTVEVKDIIKPVYNFKAV